MTHRIACSDIPFACPSDIQPEVHFHLSATHPCVLLKHATAHTSGIGLPDLMMDFINCKRKKQKCRQTRFITRYVMATLFRPLQGPIQPIQRPPSVPGFPEEKSGRSVTTKEKLDTFKTVSLSNLDIVSFG
jgi:hypothetical protein